MTKRNLILILAFLAVILISCIAVHALEAQAAHRLRQAEMMRQIEKAAEEAAQRARGY
jgi:hypothetical protein